MGVGGDLIEKGNREPTHPWHAHSPHSWGANKILTPSGVSLQPIVFTPAPVMLSDVVGMNACMHRIECSTRASKRRRRFFAPLLCDGIHSSHNTRNVRQTIDSEAPCRAMPCHEQVRKDPPTSHRDRDRERDRERGDPGFRERERDTADRDWGRLRRVSGPPPGVHGGGGGGGGEHRRHREGGGGGSGLERLERQSST